MTADLARHLAAQAKADELIRAVAETPEAGPLLRVAVTDVETGQRLATGFVTYQPGTIPLRLVESNWRCRDCDTWNGVRDARRCFTCNSPRR